MDFLTEFEFELPKGYVDADGNLHKKGVMRLSNAADEILPLRDPNVIANPGYLTIILLTRVITRLGNLPHIDTRVIEKLFSSDLAYLQTMYQTINAVEELHDNCTCPQCGHRYTQPVNFTRAE